MSLITLLIFDSLIDSVVNGIENLKNMFFDAGELIGDIYQNIVDVFILGIDSMTTFYVGLIDQQDYMQSMIEQIDTGTFDGVNLVTIIGGYHYLVGDLMFNYTYIVLMFGSGIMVYRMMLMIYSFVKSMISNDTLGFSKLKASIGSKFIK